MKTVILLHGLHMHSWHLVFMRKELIKDKNLDVRYFGYPSTLFNDRILYKLNRLVNCIPIDNEIVLVGHSMGGLVSRLFLSTFKPKRKIKLITLGTPHNGSLVANTLNKTFLRFLLGRATRAGLTEPIPAWDNSYPLISIAGVKSMGIVRILTPHSKEKSDGTVFLSETIVENATHVILENIHHTQLIAHPRAIEEVKKWI